MTNHTTFKTPSQISNQTFRGTICIVCHEKIAKGEMTVGPYNADGELSFLCGRHLRGSQFIGLLADYMVAERQRLISHEPNLKLSNGANRDAWFLY